MKNGKKWWIILLIIFIIANYVTFFVNCNPSYSLILNYVAITVCSFSLGLWLPKS